MKKKLVFIGSRNKINRLAAVADALGYEIAGILDSHYYGNRADISGIPIIGSEQWLTDSNNSVAMDLLDNCVFFPANTCEGRQVTSQGEVDLSILRKQRLDLMDKLNLPVCNLIHPDSLNGRGNKFWDCELGKGIFIDYNCAVDGCDDVRIGDYCTFMFGTSINHTAHLGRNVQTGPMVYLNACYVSQDTYFGHGSSINNQKTKHKGVGDNVIIGENCTIWTRAVVDRHMPNNTIFTDNGRLLKKHGYN